MRISDMSHQQDIGLAPVVARAFDREAGEESPRHCHPTAQLLYAVRGVMLIETDQGQWIVPPTRAIWVPIGVWHKSVMLGEVLMRTVYIREEKLDGLPTECCVVGVSPLLRELILAAMALPLPYDEQGRDGRLVQLLLDEIQRITESGTLPARAFVAASAAPVSGAANTADDERSLQEWAKDAGHGQPYPAAPLCARDRPDGGTVAAPVSPAVGLRTAGPGESVLEVALALGYASPSAFSAMFKRELGVPPSLFYK